MATLNIASLKLSGSAKKGAKALLAKHPEVQFTSGLRNVKEQARAMAGNVVKNRKWIKQTYSSSKASKACQKWVDDNPKKTKKSEIQDGLNKVLSKLSKGELGKLSKHLSGEAFDVQPVTKNAKEIKVTIRGLPGLKKFLEKEGGLVRWHAQF